MCHHSVLNLSPVERVKNVDSQTPIKTKIAPKLRLAKIHFFWVLGTQLGCLRQNGPLGWVSSAKLSSCHW